MVSEQWSAENDERLEEAMEQVQDRASFLAFIQVLIADRYASMAQERVQPSSPYSPDAGGWENITLETFFEAAFAWAENSERLPEEPSWRAFASFLYAGRIYE